MFVTIVRGFKQQTNDGMIFPVFFLVIDFLRNNGGFNFNNCCELWQNINIHTKEKLKTSYDFVKVCEFKQNRLSKTEIVCYIEIFSIKYTSVNSNIKNYL